MKTWAMTKELTENPDKEFISYELGGGRDVLKTKSIDGAIRFSNEEGNWHEVLIGVDLDREWEEVKQPVDFITAVESGKEIGVEYSGSHYRNMSLPNLFYELQQDHSDTTIRLFILKGKWYIED